MRLVVDFRSLNKKVVDDKFSLTKLDDVLDKLEKAKYLSTLYDDIKFRCIQNKDK